MSALDLIITLHVNNPYKKSELEDKCSSKHFSPSPFPRIIPFSYFTQFTYKGHEFYKVILVFRQVK